MACNRAKPTNLEGAIHEAKGKVKEVAGKIIGKRMDRPGAFMQATIVSDIAPDNPANREEFFGPVALFFRVKNDNEAIALANDSDFGLGGSVFTQDIARGQCVSSIDAAA